jgi:hypothetical protein
MRAFVLVQTETNSGPVAGALRMIPGVKSADDLRGPYDAIALAGGESRWQSIDGIVAEILKHPGVTRAIVAPLAPTETRSDEAA